MYWTNELLVNICVKLTVLVANIDRQPFHSSSSMAPLFNYVIPWLQYGVRTGFQERSAGMLSYPEESYHRGISLLSHGP